MSCSEARIEKKYKVTGADVLMDMLPYIGSDFLLDIMDNVVLKCVSAPKSEDRYSLKANV